MWDALLRSVPRYWTAAKPAAQANARIIIEEFSAAGQPPAITIAALVNAYAESQWNNTAKGDGGWSVGLFQLHRRSGAGRGMTEAECMDPRLNTRRILQEVDRYGGALRNAYNSGASVAELAAIFSRDIERPARRDYEMARRAKMTRELFGVAVADVQGNAMGNQIPMLIQRAPLVASTAGGLGIAATALAPEFWLAAAASATLGALALVALTRRA